MKNTGYDFDRKEVNDSVRLTLLVGPNQSVGDLIRHVERGRKAFQGIGVTQTATPFYCEDKDLGSTEGREVKVIPGENTDWELLESGFPIIYLAN